MERPLTTHDLVRLAVALGTRAERITNNQSNSASDTSFLLNTATALTLTALGDEIMAIVEQPENPKDK